MKDLSDYRRSYEKNTLLEQNLPDNPLRLFFDWFHEVDSTDMEANAMTVASISPDGFPRSRVVLMKQFSEEGFIFFTNYQSEKGRSVAMNPKVCLSFFWPGPERQVIIKGIAAKTTEEVSDQYFNSRPLGSRLGAIISDQSSVIGTREELENKLKTAERGVAADQAIKRPAHWGGYIVKPIEMEFWQGRANRLHDRIRYTIHPGTPESWTFERLAP